MADKSYTLDWGIKPDRAVAGARSITAELLKMERVLDRVEPKLKKLGQGSSAGMNQGSAAAKKLAANLEKVADNAGNATTGLNSVGKAGAGAAAGIRGAGAAAGGVGGRLGTASTAAGQAAQAFNAVGTAATAGLAVALKVSGEIEEKWKKLAEEATAFRESMRELANIKGQASANNNIMADTLDLSLKTGMTPDKAREFGEAYENIGPTVRAKGHYRPGGKEGTQEERDRLERDVMADTGITARRIGLDEETAGEALGTAGLFHVFTDRQQAAGIFGGAQEGLSKGKLKYKPGFKALSKSAAKLVDDQEDAAAEGSTVGRLGGYDEAAVYMGALSLGTGTADQAGHRMVQISRLLHTQKDEAQAALKAAGITDDMDDPTRLIQLDKHLKEQKVGDRLKWLADNKLGSEATREATVAGMKQSDVLQQRLAELRRDRASGATGRRVLDANDRAFKADRSAQAGGAAAIEGTMDVVEGEQVEKFETAKRLAEQRERIRHPDRYHSIPWNIGKYVASPLTQGHRGVGGAANYQETGGDTGAIPVLKAQGKKVGIDVAEQFPEVDSNDYRTRAKAFAAASRAIEKAGGDPNNMQELREGAGKAVKGMRANDDAAGGNGPGPQAANDAAKKLDVTNRLLGQLVHQGAGPRGGTQVSMRELPDIGGGYNPLRMGS